MKFHLALIVGAVALLGLFGVTIAEMRSQATEPESEVEVYSDESVLVDSEERDGQVRPIAPIQPTYRDHHPQRARGLTIRPDGVTVGRIFYIDRSSLTLLPVQNARIGVMQSRRVIAQTVTDEHGVFAVPDLTPWGVYSLTAASEEWVSVFSAIIIPAEDAELQASGEAAEDGDLWVNEIRLVAAQSADAVTSDESQAVEMVAENPENANPQGDDANLLDVDAQAIPREDFIVALRAGLFGTDVCGLPPGLANSCCSPCGGVAGAGGTGGGGGGGGGGAGGGGLGGALIGAGIGAAIGAAAGSDSGSPASPFVP